MVSYHLVGLTELCMQADCTGCGSEVLINLVSQMRHISLDCTDVCQLLCVCGWIPGSKSTLLLPYMGGRCLQVLVIHALYIAGELHFNVLSTYSITAALSPGSKAKDQFGRTRIRA